MNTVPRVSVLIPSYNQSKLLKEAIESVLSQTFSDFELIINDNASTDDTQTMVQQFLHDARVRYFRNEVTIPMHENWNKCLEHPRASYIKYLCSDDKLRPRALELMVAAMDENPDVAIVSSGRQYFGEKDRLFILDWKGKYDGKETILNTLRISNWMASPSTVMCRKENFEHNKFRGYKWVTDWDMWIRHLGLGHYYGIPEVLMDERVHSGSATRNFSMNMIKLSEEYELFRNVRDNGYSIQFPGREEELEQLVKRKALECSRYMYSRVPRLKKKKNRIAFLKMLAIVRKEKVLVKSLQVQVEKRLLGKQV
ncbi:Glycosyltransferase involved in cell wall bisynthesis [Cnuella takakiae]|uniref:Glycosyltransferase involved in cell wall bisynthesis n=1 Tax=Cnuella takakiae TaxID=1302690 RepID=A0A1M4UUA1_9BACT|nr:glycosyltransferase [Cnuella takakiae]OLY92776.1 hypothetical protein BUE76_13420 [Cnuella takakiae]SHE60306.1 Glycosyltransferase involved in cell wall bisynthesis [Cnuella takakiae]